MSNDLYPTLVRGLTFTVLKTDEFDTIVQASPSRIETRIAQTYNPIRRWQFIYDVLFNDPTNIVPGLAYTDLQTLRGFYLRQQGQFGDFLYDDPDEDSVGPALLPGGTPNLQARLQLIQDPTTSKWYSPVQQLIGGQFYEDISDLGVSGIAAYANGIAQVPGPSNDYVLAGPGLSIPGFSSLGLYIAWNGTPSAPITAQFNFFFRVRFETDKQDWEKFVYNLWTVGGSEGKNGSGNLKLITARTSLI